MSRKHKLLHQLLGGEVDQTIRFDRLCSLLRDLGFDERQRGSHRIFSKQGIPEILNLQPRPDGTAKAYQAKQVREVLLRRGLFLSAREEADDEQ